MSARPFALALVLPLLAACGHSGASSWAGTISDSAGVAVVQNPTEGMWGAGQGWTVQETLSIGEMGGDEHYQFGQIAGVDVDATGNVYIADQQARDVRVYDATGKYVRTIGKPGSGPGEFGPQISGLEVVGDQIFVPDIGNQRLSRFSLEGGALGDTHIDFAQAIPARWDEMPAGRLVAQLRHIAFTGPATAPTGDAIRAVQDDGAFGDTVGMLPPGETITMSGGRMQVKMFQPEPIWDADESGEMVSGRNNEFRVEVRDAAGAVTRIVTRPSTPRPVTERDKKVILDALREVYKRAGAPPQAVEQALSLFQFADNYPAFASLALGPQGSIWAQRVRTGDELTGGAQGGTFDVQDMGSTEWDVFEADGKYLGTVTFPGRFQPVRVLGDRFYGIAKDSLDVQSMKVYRVVTG
jgi:6-bladed beta-propeller